MRNLRIVIAVLLGFLVAAGGLSMIVAAFALSSAPKGSDSLISWAFLLVLFLFFGAMAMTLLSVVDIEGTRNVRRNAVATLAGSVAFLLSLFLLGFTTHPIKLGWKLRLSNFRRAAESAKPLIQAIETYTKDHSIPPGELDELVPDYLPAIPFTGIRAYPEFRYRRGKPADPQYGNSRWILSIPCGFGPLNFDSFIYLPTKNYPEEGFGGRLERVGDWAYVHE